MLIAQYTALSKKKTDKVRLRPYRSNYQNKLNSFISLYAIISNIGITQKCNYK
jgi:hypothetical protein